jgi:hypothetical protein
MKNILAVLLAVVITTFLHSLLQVVGINAESFWYITFIFVLFVLICIATIKWIDK